MHPSFLLRVLFGHALLSCLKMSVTVTDADEKPRASSSSPSVSTGRAHISSSSSIIDDEVHEEIHPGPSFRSHLNPQPSGGFVSDWNRDWFQAGGGSFGGRISQGKCVNIPDNMTLCRSIGYGQMRLPNLLEHDSIKEATQQAASWVPLFNVHCHPDTQVFLCSLFAPVCLDRPIWPCKTLCESVKAGCESRMRKYGFPWPDMLRCDQFPPDNDLCIGMRQDNQSDESSCPACVQPETFESIVDNFCSADYAMKIRLEQAVVSDSDMKLLAGKKKKVYKRGTLTSKELRDATFYIENGAQCQCSITDDLMLSDSKKNSYYYLIMGSRKNNRLVVSFIERVDRKSVDMSKAMDAIRKGRICKEGIQIITTEDGKKNSGKERDSKLSDKKSDGVNGKDVKDGKRENGKRADGKKDDGKKGDGKRRDGKGADGRKGSGKKGTGSPELRKTENGKRSTESLKSNPEKNENRKRQKDLKANQKKSTN